MSDISGKVVMLRCADSKVIMREWKLIVKEWGVAGADAALARARMALLSATAQVLRNALAVLGVSAPMSMDRDAAPAATEGSA